MGGRPAARRHRSSRVSGPHAAYWINAVSFVVLRAAHRAHPGAAAPVGEGDEPRALARPRGRARARPPLARAADGHRRVERRDARIALRQRRRGRAREGLASTPATSASACSSAPAGSASRSAASSAGCSPSAVRSASLYGAGDRRCWRSGYGVARGVADVWVAAACVVVAGFGNGTAVVCNVAARPARRAGRAPRPRLHDHHEHQLRRARACDGGRRACHRRARRRWIWVVAAARRAGSSRLRSRCSAASRRGR